ncbi:hypothetical protein LRQ11_18440 [Pseudomonas sp. MAFF 311095]|uniref:Uncharacterized protein n=1 Tax=Pseudomonas petroselini TaxID=2899822 RepID=A0ABS8QYU8_9PSED|nr:hypothetical protein [Pseudomonas petroselini]MCD7040872.1 hypothetical protein [Pseudomonas petroselini]MCD7048228.1 hypothetical protein [Pseudomonas petroselini]MCD7070727.1 hypothetical protein [Pseudomonas petroselini]MCD7080693.1 hypothetical protein [Pseudomonas petroselini]
MTPSERSHTPIGRILHLNDSDRTRLHRYLAQAQALPRQFTVPAFTL